MKIISFTHSSRASYGVLTGEEIVDLGAMPGAPADLRAALEAGPLRVPQGAKPSLKLADVQLAPVVPNPGKILCVGHNYETHRLETGRAKADHPSIFTRFADTLIAHGQPIVRPSVSTNLDFEGELAIVIGKGGRNISADDALSHVAGYACFNDASVRDWQWHTSQFTPGKNFPATGPFGPWMTTPDELPDLSQVVVTTRLNGEVVQQQPVADMIFPIPDIIAYISTFTPLSPGDVIATGTPGGVGAKRTPPLWMKPDDVVEVEISGVGHLINPIADQA